MGLYIVCVSMCTHQGRLEIHLPLVHSDLVGAGLGSSEEGDVFVLEGLQGLGLSSLVHRQVVSTHTQPQVMGEPSLFALFDRGSKRQGSG